MSVVLIILSVLALLFSIFTLMYAETMMHNIQGMIGLVLTGILLSGGFIVEAINQLKKSLKKERKEEDSP